MKPVPTWVGSGRIEQAAKRASWNVLKPRGVAPAGAPEASMDHAVPFARVLSFEAVHNFRDYGGYAADGGRLRTGRLYRSGQHWGATPADLERVADLKLRTVVDLRGPGERDAAPCPRPGGFTAEVIFVEEDTTGLAPHVEAAGDGPSVEAARAGMLRGYASMPFRVRLIPIMARYFEALARTDGASLVHCMAGKDRTGLSVALLHRALGVHRDDLMADYLLTRTAGDIAARVAAGARQVRAGGGRPISDEAIAVLMGVEPEYLDAAFAAIDERHGGVDAYLSQVLDVTAERREAIRARVIA